MSDQNPELGSGPGGDYGIGPEEGIGVPLGPGAPSGSPGLGFGNPGAGTQNPSEFAPGYAPAPPTSGRLVRLRLDVPDNVMIEMPWGTILSASDINRGIHAVAFNMELISGVGWRPISQQSQLSPVHENTSAQGAIKTSQADGGTLQVPQTDSDYLWTKVYAWRAPTELTGATTGASADLANQADYGLQKIVTQNDWTVAVLGADEDAFPGVCDPLLGSLHSNIVLDRSICDSVQDTAAAAKFIRFQLGTSKLSIADYPLIWYFNGPAGSTQTTTGNGQYGLVFTGSGEAQLYEYNVQNADNPWFQRFIFDYSPANQVGGNVHRVEVIPIVWQSPENGAAGSIVFRVTTSNASSVRGPANNKLYPGRHDPGVSIYNVPYWVSPTAASAAPPPVLPTFERIDCRRDLRPIVQLSADSYSTSDTCVLLLDPFQLDYLPAPVAIGGSPITCQVFIATPTAFNVGLSLFDMTNAPEDPLDPTKTGLPGFDVSTTQANPNLFVFESSFSAPAATGGQPGADTYQLRITYGTFTGAPTVTEVRYIKDGATINVAPGEFDLCALPSGSSKPGVSLIPTAVTNFSITGPEADPSHESGSFEISDLTDQYPILKVRAEYAVRCDTRYPQVAGFTNVVWTNPQFAGYQSVIFDGYSLELPGDRRGSQILQGTANGLSPYPAPDWDKRHMSALGKWKRVAESRVPYGWNFGMDPYAAPDPALGYNPPYKATDVIQTFYEWAGFPPNQINVGVGTDWDSTIRLYPSSQVQSLTVTPGQNIDQPLMQVARDYLYAVPAWDANACQNPKSTQAANVLGMWTLLGPQYPPYNNLVNFVTEPNSTTFLGSLGAAMAHMLTAYGATMGNGFNQHQPVQNVPIWKGSIHEWTTPPEADFICVTGTGELGATSASQVPQLHRAYAANTESFDFFFQRTANPASRDYVGRVKPELYVDTIGLSGAYAQQAVGWVCRRYYDATAHAVDFMTFVAPLVLVYNLSDPRQFRPRPLRYYDGVTVDGVQWIVRNVNPLFRKDQFQFALYQLEKPNAPYA